MDRFVSDPMPLSPAVAASEFSRAHLVFYEVDHSGPSFEALAFLNAPEVGPGAKPSDDGYAGSFTIFGHGGCSGDEGHCHVPEYQKDPFDFRPLHGLTPQTKLIDITEGLRRVCEEADHSHLQVTVVPVVPGEEADQPNDVLFFSAMRLVAFD